MGNGYSLGLDFGTASVRALLISLDSGAETATAVWNYQHGTDGVIGAADDPHLARQHPADYLDGSAAVLKEVLARAKAADPDFAPERVLGIGVDTTGSTPIPVDGAGRPLCFQDRFRDNPAALAWLWKDHTAVAEAEELTQLAGRLRPDYLRHCGGRYSSEWFWAKILRLARQDPEVYRAAAGFVELADFIPAQLCGAGAPGEIRRSACAAGHKALYSRKWGGLPDEEFLAGLDPRLAGLRARLYDRVFPAGASAGRLSPEWARRTGLPAGCPVSVGAFDAHLGAVGSGIRENGLVKVMGTSTCDLMVFPAAAEARLEAIEGMCGFAEDSIIPGLIGLEAGQSGVGDIFAWFAGHFLPAGYQREAAAAGRDGQQWLTEKAARLKPGSSGLLALDWNNGNRSILVDQWLTGLLVGQTLGTRPEEVYRSLVEATAFGARVIVDQIEAGGISIGAVIACGGISRKNPFLMQIYSNILERPIRVAGSEQTCALGAAIAGAVAAGAFKDIPAGQDRCCRFEAADYRPEPAAVPVYRELYRLYRQLHDGFGRPAGPLAGVMKDLLKLKRASNAS
ncbi:MAG TPA: ribulokinase [bacterium]|nr:ribulokinase [bacterium]